MNTPNTTAQIDLPNARWILNPDGEIIGTLSSNGTEHLFAKNILSSNIESISTGVQLTGTFSGSLDATDTWQLIVGSQLNPTHIRIGFININTYAPNGYLISAAAVAPSTTFVSNAQDPTGGVASTSITFNGGSTSIVTKPTPNSTDESVTWSDWTLYSGVDRADVVGAPYLHHIRVLIGQQGGYPYASNLSPVAAPYPDNNINGKVILASGWKAGDKVTGTTFPAFGTATNINSSLQMVVEFKEAAGIIRVGAIGDSLTAGGAVVNGNATAVIKNNVLTLATAINGGGIILNEAIIAGSGVTSGATIVGFMPVYKLADFTATISGDTLDVTAIAAGEILPYGKVVGTGVSASTYIKPYGSNGTTGTGGIGTYQLSASAGTAATSLNSGASGTIGAKYTISNSNDVSTAVAVTFTAGPGNTITGSSSNSFGRRAVRNLNALLPINKFYSFTNWGIGGTSHAAFYARLPKVLANNDFDIFILPVGSPNSDINSQVIYDTQLNTTMAGIQLVKDSGAIPILWSMPPHGTDITISNFRVQQSEFWKSFCLANSLPFVDGNTIFSNGAIPGEWIGSHNEFTAEGLHFNDAGYDLLASYFMDAILTASTMVRSQSSKMAINQSTTPSFLKSYAAGNLPDGSYQLIDIGRTVNIINGTPTAKDGNPLLRNIGTRCYRNIQWQTGFTQAMTMCEVPLKDDTNFVKLVFDGPMAAGGSALGSGTTTLKLGLECPVGSGVYIPVTFNNGSSTGSFTTNGGSIETDFILTPFMKKGQSLGVRPLQNPTGSVGAAGVIYSQSIMGQGINPPQFYQDGLNNNGTDLTVTAGSIGSTFGTLAYFPTAVLSFSELPSFMCLGTSIDYGQNDLGQPDIGLIGMSKLPGRYFGTMNWGLSSDTIQNFAANINTYPYTRIKKLLNYCSHVQFGGATNDIFTNSRTVAQLLADYATVIATMPKKKIFMQTVLPRPTDSTDTPKWITVANQTVSSAPDIIKTSWNYLLMQLKVPGMSVCVDINASAEAIVNGVPSGKWNVKPCVATGCTIAIGTPIPNASGGTTAIGVLTIGTVTSGIPAPGMLVTGVAANTFITGLKDASLNQWYVSVSQTVASTTLTMVDINEGIHPLTAMYNRMLSAFNPGTV